MEGNSGRHSPVIPATMVNILVGIALAAIHTSRAGFTVTGLAVPVIILLAVINPFFEEVLEAGYFIHSLRRYGMWPAVLGVVYSGGCYIRIRGSMGRH